MRARRVPRPWPRPCPAKKRSPSRARASQPTPGSSRPEDRQRDVQAGHHQLLLGHEGSRGRAAPSGDGGLGGGVARPTSSSRAARTSLADALEVAALRRTLLTSAELASVASILRSRVLQLGHALRGSAPRPPAWPAPRTAGSPASCAAPSSSASILPRSLASRAVSAATSNRPAMGMRSSSAVHRLLDGARRVRRGRGHHLQTAPGPPGADQSPPCCSRNARSAESGATTVTSMRRLRSTS